MSSLTGILRNITLLAVTVGHAACGSDGALGDQPVLTGQINAWSRGEGYIFQASLSSASPVALASAPIDATGNFSITLPGATALAPNLTQGHFDPHQPTPSCTGKSLQINPQDFATTGLVLQAVSGSIKLTLNQGSTSAPTTRVSYVYVDHDVTETGGMSKWCFV